MNKRLSAILAATALVSLGSSRAQAQEDVTPPEVIALGEYHIETFSVFAGDGSIAFPLATTNVSNGTVSSNIWTFPPAGSVTKVTSYPDETFGLALDPTYGPNSLAYRVSFETAPQGKPVPGPTLFVDRAAITTDDIHVKGFSWGPDTASLVFLATTDANPTPAFYTTAGASGTTPQHIWDCADCGTPQWSPIDQWIAYAAPDGIHLVNSSGGSDNLAIPGASSPLWSPLTGQLAYLLGSNIHVGSIDHTVDVQLTHNDQGMEFSELAWGPDEAFIAAIGRPVGLPGGPGLLYVVGTDASHVIPLSTQADATSPQWLPVAPQTPGNIGSPAQQLDLYYICERSLGEHICFIRGFNGTSTTCDPTTWPGCCAGNLGLPGTSQGACGVNAPCAVCTDTQVCHAGQCVPRTPCDPAGSCFSGCCDFDGICQTKNNAQYCGLGRSCQQCIDGQICDPQGSGCIYPVPICDTSCLGCCGDNGCQKATPTACGAGGDKCTGCNTAIGETCLSSGRCGITATSACDVTTNCADGCCSNGHCVHPAAWTDSACGAGLPTCHDCVSEMGGVCNKTDGTCRSAVDTCYPCPNGCCDSNNKCAQSYLLNASCGGIGSICQNCPIDYGPNYTCVNQGVGLGGQCGIASSSP